MVSTLLEAERLIVKALQSQAFPQEIKSLKGHRKMVTQTSPIVRLDPYIDENDIIRVGGRIRRANLPLEISHPVIIPKKGHITELIVRHHHVIIVSCLCCFVVLTSV